MVPRGAGSCTRLLGRSQTPFQSQPRERLRSVWFTPMRWIPRDSRPLHDVCGRFSEGGSRKDGTASCRFLAEGDRSSVRHALVPMTV